MATVWRELSYEEVPALSVRGAHLRRALRTVTLAWMFGVVWLSASSGSHIRILAGRLGFNDLAFGVLAALLLRCLALLWLIGMPDPGAAKIRGFTRHIGVNTYNALTTRLFYPVRVFGWALRGRAAARRARHPGLAPGGAGAEQRGGSAP
jgi:hypothetical protein